MAEKQKTVSQDVVFVGAGLHTGVECKAVVKAAAAGEGIKFKRVDLDNTPLIPALAENVVDTARGTMLGANGATVSTIEHLLAALCALHIDNALIEINGPEIPILKGNARPFFDALKQAGTTELDAEREYFEVSEKIVYSEPERGVEIVAYPSDTFKVDVKINYDSSLLRSQYASLDCLCKFEEEIADSRTFCFFKEIEQLVQANLIKGGDLENAIVIVDSEISQSDVDTIANLLNKKGLVAKQGYVSNPDLYFDNEPARHKLLDVIGDLMLVGMPIKGHIIATIPGHKANTEFAKLIRKQIKSHRGPQAPRIDINATPVYDINQIKKILPHRYPFQLVDKVMSITDTEIVGIKNVTNNEPFFQGHFPEEPVMPGVLHLEAMAQCGGVLALSSVEEPERWSTYFVSMDKIKFRRKVVPGDVLVFKLKLISPIRRGIVHMSCLAFVGDQLATEAELMAQIVKNK
ncbi:MAG: bifunctional UDP-3-O-[3-hydroxymyristoyl] N-acetylglucosamine deacetylase/3-hydroxyacyl-ACP dehydratase [Bacteroidales bacterium]|jgi:UDP-3-O-[3-hydroxymyristoyl] N-acetylglucosamine deacetylase/3-hydroxyacyl-[acyl-carrier-protein] dehydratase|nr:bifunctional UDP-3-O-[3-hydroxymyristoyl] N-acetylglucosamine deacetylase/3-hydroxyacyl-ACP dehydratase [Bacteroidales bacterium]